MSRTPDPPVNVPCIDCKRPRWKKRIARARDTGRCAACHRKTLTAPRKQNNGAAL